MKFRDEWDKKTRIELLQRWILVQSFVYYILNENIVPDYEYDKNVLELFALRESDPNAWRNSQYYLYFREYEPGCTSGFELLGKAYENDQALYRRLHIDAAMAIDVHRFIRSRIPKIAETYDLLKEMKKETTKCESTK